MKELIDEYYYARQRVIKSLRKITYKMRGGDYTEKEHYIFGKKKRGVHIRFRSMDKLFCEMIESREKKPKKRKVYK